MTQYQSLTVEQLEALARRARDRGSPHAMFYTVPDIGMLVEVTNGSNWYEDGPDEAVIDADGSIRA